MRLIGRCLLIFSLLIFVLSSCAPKENTVAPAAQASLSPSEENPQYSNTEFVFSEDLPSRIIISGEGEELTYSKLIADYSRTYNKISSSKSAADTDIIYTADDDWNIFEIAANEDYIVWYEVNFIPESSQNYAIKVYTRESGQIRTAFETVIKAGDQRFQIYDLGLVGNTLYYLWYDYENESCKIIAQDLKENKDTIFVEYPFTKDSYPFNHPITFLTVKDSLIICSNKKDGVVSLEAYNANTGQIEHEAVLPDYVALTYSADFDDEKDTFALYFQKNKENSFGIGDGIAVIKAGEEEIKEIFTLNDNVMVYEDKISIYGDSLYYVLQKNVSGPIIDHYEGTLYNYAEDTHQTLQYCFGLNQYKNSLYGLFFDPAAGANKVIYDFIIHLQ